MLFSLFQASDSVFSQALDNWGKMNPELILFLFLPPLLFSEALNLNFHHAMAALKPALLLAGPGCIFGAFAMSGIMYMMMDWSYSLCLLFGSIICATDPVAVISLLRKAGASTKLRYVVTFEALLNDGSALVLYNLFFKLVELNSTALTAEEVVIYFIRVIIISPLIGIAFGSLSLLFISMATSKTQEDDTTIQIMVTVICAYTSFFVGEYSLGVSGVIAVVSSGE